MSVSDILIFFRRARGHTDSQHFFMWVSARLDTCPLTKSKPVPYLSASFPVDHCGQRRGRGEAG